jgi:hypothetical protein
MDFFWMIPLPNSRRVIPFRLCCHATLWAFNSDRPVFCAFEVLFYQNGGHATTLSQFFHHIKLLYNQSVSVPALLPICRYPEYRVVPESGQRRGLADFGLHTRPPSESSVCGKEMYQSLIERRKPCEGFVMKKLRLLASALLSR